MVTIWWARRGTLARVEEKLDRALRLLTIIVKKEIRMSKELDDLTIQVQKNTELEASAILLIQGIAAQLAEAGQDPVKLKALADGLDASADALAAAILANTPVEPPPPIEPPVE